MKKTKVKKPVRKNILKVYLTDDEYTKILDSSKKANLTLSTFAQKICLGSQVLSRDDKQARLDLLKINADLGRLGGLLKKAIFATENRIKINALLFDITEIQALLKSKVKSI